MAGKNPHADKSPVSEFCSSRGCGHNDYREVCKPSWSALGYPQLKKGVPTPLSYQAHHLVCCAEVNKVLVAGAAAKGIKSIVDETLWCINAKPNMKAMPVWGITVMWYANDFLGLVPTTKIYAMAAATDRKKAPPFQNIPQHDYNHGGEDGYNSEVEKKLQKIAKALAKSKKTHQQKQEALASVLNTLAGRMRSQLDTRGLRAGGTHDCWMNAKTRANWYVPFSMSARPQPLPYPGEMSEGMAKKIFRQVNAAWPGIV